MTLAKEQDSFEAEIAHLPRAVQRRIIKQRRRAQTREAREERRAQRRQQGNVVHLEGETIKLRTKITPRNKPQERALQAMESHNIVVISGRVGSGKTFLAAAKATEMLLSQDSPVEKIVLVRPNEPLGKTLGFLPGSAEEKLKPYLVPILDGIEHVVGKVGCEKLLKQGKLEYVAVEHLRGRTWNNCFVIIDEANNLSARATAVALLRKGEDSKVVFCGDIRQADVESSGMELLRTIDRAYSNAPHKYVELIDTVRSPEAAYYADVFEQLGVEY